MDNYEKYRILTNHKNVQFGYIDEHVHNGIANLAQRVFDPC